MMGNPGGPAFSDNYLHRVDITLMVRRLDRVRRRVHPSRHQ